MADKDTAAADTQDQPIWVLDLLAWLDKFPIDDYLTEEIWINRIHEVLTDLPGHGLPSEDVLDPDEHVTHILYGERKVSIYEQKNDSEPPLPDGVRDSLKRELELVQSEQDISESLRCEIIIGIAAQLPTLERQALFQQVFETTLTTESERSKILVALFENLRPISDHQLLQQALEAVKSTRDESDQCRMLGPLIAKFPATESQLFQEALEISQLIQNESDRSHCLKVLANRLPLSESQLFQQILEAAIEIQGNYYQNRVFAALAAQLHISKRQFVFQKALDIAKYIPFVDSQCRAFATIAAQFLPSEGQFLLKKALKTLDLIHGDDKDNTLAYIAARIPASEPKLLKQVLEVVDKIDHPTSRLNVLHALEAQLPTSEPQLLQQALKSAFNIQGDSQIYGIACLAALSPEPERCYWFQKAINSVREIVSVSDRAEKLAFVSAKLSASETVLLEEVLKIAKTTQGGSNLSKVISALAAKLNPKMLEKALDIARTIHSPSDRSSALTILANTLQSQSIFYEALDAVEKIELEGYRSSALVDVVTQLPVSEPKLFRKALKMAGKMQDYCRSKVLVAVAGQLPSVKQRTTILQKILKDTRALTDVFDDRTSILTHIAVQLPMTGRRGASP